MSNIIDWFHNTTNKQSLNYIIRIRAINNEIQNLSNSATILNMKNATIDDNEYICLNRGYISLAINDIINDSEDFTITTYLSIMTSEVDTIFFSTRMNLDQSLPRNNGDVLIWYCLANPNSVYMSILDPHDYITWMDQQSFTNYPCELMYFTITRSNNTVYFFLNGTLLSTISYTEKIFCAPGITAIIGGIKNYEKYSWRQLITCKFKDFCIIKGKALWTENFTPPTTYLPDRM